MLYHFYVHYRISDGDGLERETTAEYVTDFSGVYLLAQLLEASDVVIAFRVAGEGKAMLPRSRFNAEEIHKWRFP